jgi:sRNA-binding carbon storage regulator CsrA
MDDRIKMLILGTPIGSSVMIGDNIRVELVDVRYEDALIEITAPPGFADNFRKFWLEPHSPFKIGGGVAITFGGYRQGHPRLGFTAPASMKILRRELWEEQHR